MKENGFTLKKAKSKWYPTETITDVDYAGDLALLVNASAQAESLLHKLEQAARGIGLYINSDKAEFISFNKDSDISSLNGKWN